MSNRDSESQHEFKRELSKLIRKHAKGLQTSEFAHVLGEFHCDLAQGSLQPTIEVTNDQEPWALRVSYSTAISLEEHLDGYLEVGGVCLEVDREFPPLADVILTLTGTHIDDTVRLVARAVSETPAGLAFQVTPPDEDSARRLRDMPAKMRAAAEEKLRAQPTLAEPAQPGPDKPEPSESVAEKVAVADKARPAPNTTPPRAQPLELAGEPAERWQLEETRLPDILCGLLGQQGLCVLDIDLAERRAQVVLDGADVLDVEIYPPVPKESLEGLLAAAGKLNDAEIRRAHDYAAQHNIEMAEALVELDFLTYAELGIALKTRCRFLLGLLWERRAGQVARHECDQLTRRFRAPASPLAYHLFGRIRDGLSSGDEDWLDERRTFFRAHLISRSQAQPCDIHDLDLDEKQARFFELVLETPRPFSDILRITRLSERKVVVLLEVFRRLGMLELQQVNPFTRQRTRFFEQLEAMQARATQGNFFEVLGIHWTAHQDEVEQGYVERIESLSDDNLPDNLDEAARLKVDELLAVIDEAYEVLSDTKRRAKYRDEVVGEFEKKNALKMFEKQADTAKLRRDLGAAIDAYQRVLEIDPRHAQANKDIEVLEKLLAAERRDE